MKHDNSVKNMINAHQLLFLLTFKKKIICFRDGNLKEITNYKI